MLQMDIRLLVPIPMVPSILQMDTGAFYLTPWDLKTPRIDMVVSIIILLQTLIPRIDISLFLQIQQVLKILQIDLTLFHKIQRVSSIQLLGRVLVVSSPLDNPISSSDMVPK